KRLEPRRQRRQPVHGHAVRPAPRYLGGVRFDEGNRHARGTQSVAERTADAAGADNIGLWLGVVYHAQSREGEAPAELRTQARQEPRPPDEDTPVTSGPTRSTSARPPCAAP